MQVKSNRAYLLFRAASGLAFMFIGLAFPISIYKEYGFSYGNVYDHGSHVVGQVRYIWAGLGLGCLSFVAGLIQFLLAKFHLKYDR
ncbi:hypothetical protein GCM10007898_13040 [Dyella flagellata]|uniref:Uncharacterized protein n=1 Tax=Dyella flagellata TaxID=1867833 RepID=A0ABQ5X978_9GAMM|nr:hypothetical protein GCM10007898_13040 [Dyella flagellata]